MANVGTAAAGKTLIGTGLTSQSSFASIGTLSGLTNHGVLIAQGAGAFVAAPVGNDGQVLLGAGGANPAFASLTSPDNSITFVVGANSLSLAVTGGATVGKTITGNSGGALSPTAGNWNIVGGTTGLTFAGAVSTLTLGGTLVVANGGTGAASFTAFAPIIGGTTTTNPFQSAATGQGTSGFVFTSTGAGSAPTFQAISASGAITTITGDSGGAETPTAGGNFNILGTGSITTVGTANTETVQLTGLTNHAVLVGAGTATITKVGPSASTGQILQNNAAADPSYSTATYPSTTTINQILYSSSTNVVGGLASTARSVLTTNSTGVPTWVALTDGQVVVGSTAGSPAAATITAGAGISVTNASNTITIASTQSFTWTDVTSPTQAMLVFNGYSTDRGAGVTYTLPASGLVGDVMKIDGKLGITTIAQNAGQQIVIGSTNTTVGVTGTLTGTNVGDCVTLRCITAGVSTIWRVEDMVGNWTPA